jgi:hypothetical protein
MFAANLFVDLETRRYRVTLRVLSRLVNYTLKHDVNFFITEFTKIVRLEVLPVQYTTHSAVMNWLVV